MHDDQCNCMMCGVARAMGMKEKRCKTCGAATSRCKCA